MNKLKKDNLNKNDMIRVSEIGQFHYCSVAWYLQRYGYKPISSKLEIGLQKHIEYGKILDLNQVNRRKSKKLSIIGYTTLILGILILIFEVSI
jgi:hypothetical protein